jgi:hypothetical protein
MLPANLYSWDLVRTMYVGLPVLIAITHKTVFTQMNFTAFSNNSFGHVRDLISDEHCIISEIQMCVAEGFK